ncbi:uncharacterized protein LOC135828630 [Sycon ciliatum]|uniref:uncharacterized protein LOC135828630 n=1 Tax=Sycon ciliatum TaxID=27933 RepID=UPI0031F6A8C5
MLRLTLLLVAVVFTGATKKSDPSYDHQTKTYHSFADPAECSSTAGHVTPFFSPDSSIQTYVSLIESAESSIDVYTPGFSSWSGCTHYDTKCVGCTIANQRNESFPVFGALLNAVHRGVQVRLITNNYNTPTCAGLISPLDFLFLNGVEIRFYASTTFMHTKYMMIDKGKKTSVSSVNFSHTSFMRNREAGVVLENACSGQSAFFQKVFDYDWSVGTQYEPTNTYSSTDMKHIKDSSVISLDVPNPPDNPSAYQTHVVNHPSVVVPAVSTNPDSARKQLMAALAGAQSSFQLMIYQITDDGLCNELVAMNKAGVDLTILVSRRIFSAPDYYKSQDCYAKLNSSGITVRLTPSYYTYSHQKFWIVDNTDVYLDTGNWSPTDFSTGSEFPPHSSSAWQDVNRDLIVQMRDHRIVSQYASVITNDGARGSYWHPTQTSVQ